MSLKLINTLTIEPDVLFLVLNYLDIPTLVSLEGTCTVIRKVFGDYEVWAKVIGRYSQRRYLGQDWGQRYGGQADLETALTCKQLLCSIGNIDKQWECGPTRIRTISLESEPVTDVAMDELGLVVALRSGMIQLYVRDSLKLVWTTCLSKEKRLTCLGINCEYVFSGEVNQVNFNQGGSPSMRVSFRETGDLSHIVSFPEDHTVNWIFPGLDNMVLVSHPSYDSNQPAQYRMFSGKLSVFSKEVEIYSQDFFLSQNSLSSCKSMFLANYIRKPGFLLLINMKSGSKMYDIPTTINVNWMNIETLQYGFITNKVVYIVYRNRSELNGTIHMKIINIEESNTKEVISLVIEDTFSLSSLKTNWSFLVTSDRKNKRVTISTDGQIVAKEDPGLKGATSCMETYADAVSLVLYVRTKRKYALVVQDLL